VPPPPSSCFTASGRNDDVKAFLAILLLCGSTAFGQSTNLSIIFGRPTARSIIRSYLPKDETDQRKNGDVTYHYELEAKGRR
jgi:hypothetical protein